MRVLFLATRFPVPPWRGDQVRAFHHLRCLAPRHEITLGALVLRPPAPEERAAVEALGVRVEVIPLGVVGALPALLRGVARDAQPFQVLLFTRRRARERVARLVAEGGFDLVHAQLVRTAPYLPAARPPAVIDFVDALSANFARRAEAEGGVRGWLSAVEAARLRRCERALVGRSAACLVVSAAERMALDPGSVRVVPNGVDARAFAYREDGRAPGRLIFAGNLGYFPNVDAARWLATDIFPRVRSGLPGAELRLVGARPAAAVRACARRPGVSLAAAVPDMAPELAGASVAVIPMRAGSGLQNKILEAMAVGTPVVTTARAAAALEVRAGEHLLVAESAEDLAAATLALLRDPPRARELARAARALVERRYRWEDSAAAVEAAWRAAAAAREA